MIWLAWRQFRAQTWVALGTLAVVFALFATTGAHLAHLYRTSGLAGCVAANACAPAQTRFMTAVKADALYPVLYFVAIAALYLAPALIGMFWGAPLVARELEAGTLRLVWTQGTTRRRWLATRLGLVGLAAMATAGLLGLAVTWWAGPIDRADALPDQTLGQFPDRFMPLVFGARGVVPLGYAALGLTVGVAAGMVVRRTVPAMAVTLVALAAAQMAVPMAARAHYRAPEWTTTPLMVGGATPSQLRIDGDSLHASAEVTIPGAWVISVRTVDPAGRPFSGPTPAACRTLDGPPDACFAAVNALHLRQAVAYQPADRFWAFQWYETGLCLAVALGIAGFGAWRVRRLRLA